MDLAEPHKRFSGRLDALFAARAENLTMAETNKIPDAFTSIILAGDRLPDDPVALAAGAPCKSLVPLAGRPLVLRVIDALAEAQEVDSLVLCGPSKGLLSQSPELLNRINNGSISWMPIRETPSSSAYHMLGSISQHRPALVTTADHAFPKATIIDYFCRQARSTGADVVAGLASYEEVMKAFPATKRTATKLADGAVCSCNLFAFLTPQARQAALFWQRCERNRKNPWKMIGVTSIPTVIRYFLGRLLISQILRTLSRRMGVTAGAVLLPFPEAAVDIDTVEDWRLVEGILTERNRS